MIPKRIFTIWLNEKKEMPPLIEKCITSQQKFAKEFGYDHEIFSLDGEFYKAPYFEECVSVKKWAKAADYLRIQELVDYGGIYLDADVEMIPGKSFDDLLEFDLFCGREENNFVSNAIIGATRNHPILEEYLRIVQSNFIGSGDLIFQPGMYLWTELLHEAERKKIFSHRFQIFPPEFFLPYNHHSDTLNVTENSRCIHHFSKSWVK